MGRFERGLARQHAHPDDQARRGPAFTLAELCATDGFCMLCGAVASDWVAHVAEAHPAHVAPKDQPLTLDELAHLEAEYNPYGFDHTGMTAVEIVRAGRDW